MTATDALDLRSARALAPPRPATFEEVYREHLDLVWRSARRLGIPDAHLEDAVQDVFVVVHRRLGDYDGRAPMRGWIFGIVAHVVRDHRRRYVRKAAPCVVFDEASVATSSFGAPSPLHADPERAERVQLLLQLMGELDDDKREVLVLAHLEEMTIPEIASALDLNVNTASARLRAARRAFDEAHKRHLARVEHESRRRR